MIYLDCELHKPNENLKREVSERLFNISLENFLNLVEPRDDSILSLFLFSAEVHLALVEQALKIALLDEGHFKYYAVSYKIILIQYL